MSGGLAAGVCLVCFIKLFTLPKEPPPPKRKAKAKRKGKPKKATVKKNFTVEKPKKTKKAKQYKPPELSEYQKELLFRYELGNVRVKKIIL